MNWAKIARVENGFLFKAPNGIMYVAKDWDEATNLLSSMIGTGDDADNWEQFHRIHQAERFRDGERKAPCIACGLYTDHVFEDGGSRCLGCGHTSHMDER